MDFERFERGYLLPAGCKDLIDVIRLRAQSNSRIFLKPVAAGKIPPPSKGELLVSGQTTAGELATLLKQKPFKIIADLMQLGVFATLNQVLGFEIICRIAAQYGYVAKKSA